MSVRLFNYQGERYANLADMIEWLDGIDAGIKALDVGDEEAFREGGLFLNELFRAFIAGMASGLPEAEVQEMLDSVYDPPPGGDDDGRTDSA